MKVLLLNQCFWPDVVATAQQLTSLACSLRERGHEVTVLAGRRGYDDRALIFPQREGWNGIDVVRIPSLALGKKSRWRRTLNFGSFLLACAGRLSISPRQDVVVALTSPPLISWLASVFTRLKGGQLIFWVMDLNPDEAIAAGWLNENSLSGTVLSRLLKSSMNNATKIVALDRFMKERIAAKGISNTKIEVIPPARDSAVRYDEAGREVFRRRHDLEGKFVVMYAGNHSPCNPLDTLLDAANRLQQRDDVVFLFVGGGSELEKVKLFARSRSLGNIRWLPYQSPADLSAMLSAADLHAVVMGDAFTGIIHPSKIYNILAVGAPFLFIGPGESHVTDIIATNANGRIAMQARHGQSNEVAKFISDTAAKLPSDLRREQNLRGSDITSSELQSRMVALIEAAGADRGRVGVGPGARTSENQI